MNLTDILQREDATLKKIEFIILVLSSFSIAAFAQQGGNKSTCIACHQDQDPPLSTPVEQLKTSVHNNPKLSCVGCHGGDPTAEDADVAMSKAKGFIGKPKPEQIPKLCSKCHSSATFMRTFNPNVPVDQYQLYLTSQHGILLKKGDKKVATCISCHGVHDIKKADDPTSPVFPANIADRCGKCHADADYMQGYSIPTDQLSEYKKSVHAQTLYEKGDLSAPTCNDCHGNHGAMPPGLSSVANVCGTCHLVQSEYFSTSPHKEAFDDMGISECEACHGNHAIHRTSDQMIGIDEKAVCTQCHDEDSQGYKVAALMRNGIDSLATEISMAEAMINKANQAGVEIQDKALNLPNSKDALIQSRVLIHTLSTEKVGEKIKQGLKAATKALEIGRQALKEVGHRRNMLIIMVVLTLLVAGFLVLYIRFREGNDAR